jgi:hypothetical protein
MSGGYTYSCGGIVAVEGVADMSTQDPAPGAAAAGWDEPLSPISPSDVRRPSRRAGTPRSAATSSAAAADGALYRILDAVNQLQAQTVQLTRRVQALEAAIRQAGVDVDGDDPAAVRSGPGLGRLRRRTAEAAAPSAKAKPADAGAAKPAASAAAGKPTATADAVPEG